MDVDEPQPQEESLVSRRSRRSTAGNRMEAAMAEMELEVHTKDADDDVDFTNDKDEEDVFDEDFESTDEEAQENELASESAAQEEDKRARKVARTRLEKVTQAAHARNKATFKPQLEEASPSKAKRRVSLGRAVDAATGKAIAERPTTHRQSMRKHTILNTTLTETRLKRSEEKKALQAPKKAVEVRKVSQAELIAQALDAEEGNIIQHRDYLKIEEEKRRRVRVVRPTVEGPLLRWTSRGERAPVPVPPPPPPPPPAAPAYGYSGGYVFPAFASTSQSSPFVPYQAPYNNNTSTSTPAMPVPPPTRMERVERNYVEHIITKSSELPKDSRGARTQSASTEISKPSWSATMEALFGSHVDWENVKVYSGRNRPMSRPTQICPLTGRVAQYRDPRTGVPFADIGAYETLTKILNHEFVWSAELGAYTRAEVPVTKPKAVGD
ncbi:YL1 nuclear protein-domain-containing protein [Favolaschia claudopus]|uniref:YL1 nuclear protein-domain-containing protein n=1 Tax=Favolaschia claudopus TaxID=2862362 RepID=A0AAW0DW10_9AGAR